MAGSTSGNALGEARAASTGWMGWGRGGGPGKGKGAEHVGDLGLGGWRGRGGVGLAAGR